MSRPNPWYTSEAHPRLKPAQWFHGTSTIVWEALRDGRPVPIQRAFRESNVSLGGAYLTIEYALARSYAENAAREIGGDPIILVVKEEFPLLPDEDLAAKLTDYRVPVRSVRSVLSVLSTGPSPDPTSRSGTPS